MNPGRHPAHLPDMTTSPTTPPQSPVDDPIQPPSPIVEHERVLARAVDIVMEHTKADGELWKQADPTELGAMVKHKGNRVNYAARRYQDGDGKDRARERIVDSALDCINYCAFIIRLVEAETPMPPEPRDPGKRGG